MDKIIISESIAPGALLSKAYQTETHQGSFLQAGISNNVQLETKKQHRWKNITRSVCQCWSD